MGQNTSSAVMQQRTEARDALDDFPTPMWATRAFIEWLVKRGFVLSDLTAIEPCANRGYMVAPMAEAFGKVIGLDVHDYGAGFEVDDYLFGPATRKADMTFMNPPFRLAQQFIERALKTTRLGVGVFVRSAYVEGEQRYEQLFSQNPPTAILQFVERVVIHKGIVRRAGEIYFDQAANNGEGKEKRASSATSYIWLFWDCTLAPDPNLVPEFHWIPKSRLRLEKETDYVPLGDLA